MKHSVLSWLKASEEDLVVVESLLKNNLATGAASFHAQQAIEKSLKAILEEYTKRIPKIHDLDKLFYEAREYIDLEFDEFTINKLNTLYIEARYPGAFGFLPNGKPSLEDIEQFYTFAKRIHAKVKTLLINRSKEK